MKYLWAYSIPTAALLGIWVGGIWTFSGLIYAFVVIPLLEVTVPFELAENKHPASVIFDVLLYLDLGTLGCDGIRWCDFWGQWDQCRS
jgi:alkane 1-monooxygenase